MVEKVPKNKVLSHLVATAGFTLVEMLVVVAVIVVVTGVVLANNNKFGGVILLENLAYDIALSSREAQIYGTSVVRFQSSFTAPFGVHFDINGANNKTYIIFGDAVIENTIYDTGEILQSTAITRGFYIGALCVTPMGGSEDCSPTSLDVAYKHPEPDAYISKDGVSCNLSTGIGCYQRARVVVTSPRADTMSICFDVNGQISVHAGNTCEY